jgi:Protein of unknown function (DUF3099)
MRSRRRPGHDQAYLVTEARQSRSEEISQRERRYLVMMGIRIVCFVVTVVMFVNHAGWLTAIPAAGAIALPYFAVVVANARQEVRGTTGFHAYQPRLPERYTPPADHYNSPGDDAGRPGDDRPGADNPGGGRDDGSTSVS